MQAQTITGSTDESEQAQFDATVRAILEEGLPLCDVRGISQDAMEGVYGLAYNEYNAGRFQEAESVFKLLCLLNHLERKYWIGLGAARKGLKRYQGAVDAFGLAGMLDLSDPQPPLYAAECLILLGQPDEAKSGLETALNACGGKPEWNALKDGPKTP
jgi:type III secretion system low calcium response chaperone LcrH/SycD